MKKILTTAALTLCVATSAFAADTVIDKNADALKFSSEIVAAALAKDGHDVLTSKDNTYSVTLDCPVAADLVGSGTDTKYRVVYKVVLENAEFTSGLAAPTLAVATPATDLTFDSANATVMDTHSAYIEAIFTVADGQTVSQGKISQKIEIKIPELKVLNDSSVKMTVASYPNVEAVIGKFLAADSKTDTVIDYAESMEVSFKANANPNAIIAVDKGGKTLGTGALDVAQTALLGTVKANVVAGVIDPETGGDIVITKVLGPKANVVFTGNFSAILDEDGKVKADSGFTASGLAFNATDAYSVNEITSDAITAAVDTDVSIAFDGKTVIPESSYAALINYDSKIFANPSPVALSQLKKDGKTDELMFAVNPNSPIFKHYVRITNTGDLAGDAYITLINDAGKTVMFDLADVTGFDSSELVAQGSTPFILTADLYAAAQMKDSSFKLVGNNHLRVKVNAACKGVSIGGYVLNSDNTMTEMQ